MKNVINPVSTYRIQFHKDFNFDDFEKIIPYLRQLGVKTIYASPIFQAVPGSQHGYDGTDPNTINPEIGSLEQLEKISGILKKNEILWLQDIVPNHLAYDERNAWLMDVLEKGPASKYASFFDINWNHPAYPGKVMVPFPGSELEKHLKEYFPDGQHYALCDWKETDKRINYRRFFLVNGLICVNIQDDEVFKTYHELIGELCAKGIFHGLRVDHVDGLFDPTKYLHDLRKLAGDKSYIVVEKILAKGEQMPDNWPIEGNSGYDFLGIVNNVFTNPHSEYELNAFYYDITGNSKPVEQQVHEKKAAILHDHMQGELENLTQLYLEVFPNEVTDRAQLKKEIADYLVACPIYRYYDDQFPVMDRDKGKDRNQLKKFYNRCMQFTGPLMAKGVEDTLMYTYNKFIGHNEVGDSPVFFGYTPSSFHEIMINRQEKYPYSMNASSTHDTKRGEDVRARLNALTDRYEEWIAHVKEWREQHEAMRANGIPDSNDEYFIYQTIAGSYPLVTEELDTYKQRLTEYLQKALREAKIHSNWTDPNVEYEKGAIEFAMKLLNDNSDFLKTFLPFFEKITTAGMINSFSQMVLKFTCPGIPDVYQGTELWDLSLVDPDNRRPVDYAVREQMLADKRPLMELWETRQSGHVKLQLLHRLLNLREQFSDVFTNGEYLPLAVEGMHQQNVLAFLRKYKDDVIFVAVPLHSSLVEDWGDTRIILPEKYVWEDVLNGGAVNSSAVGKLFEKFFVSVLKGVSV